MREVELTYAPQDLIRREGIPPQIRGQVRSTYMDACPEEYTLHTYAHVNSCECVCNIYTCTTKG